MTIVSYSILSIIDPMIRSSIGIIDHFTLLAMLSIAALSVIGITERGLVFVGKPIEKTVELVEGIRSKIERISFRVLEGSRVTVSIGVNEYDAGIGKEVFLKKQTSYLLGKTKW
ncbi:hypothetical protein ACJROX_29460 [Pseudalkalibacillus sp. A8]|uniref:hypothetical protein n=1 Tax=Pseudalkalibacillus sp. A8 TaxID=3382641 RepID=UPI0038B65B3F